MKRTISVKLLVTREQGVLLSELRDEFLSVCNRIVPTVVEHRCWNRIALHNLVYSAIRASSTLGSQMVCNSIFAVCTAYKAKVVPNDKPVPTICFHRNRSVHFDKRTYSIKDNIVSLYTLQGRIRVAMKPGAFQQSYLEQGMPKEAELVFRKGTWYFNLVLDLPDPRQIPHEGILGVDLGENVLAATSSGKLFGGGRIRHARDTFLSKRRRLQSNGSQSARQLLKKISGKEARRIKHINHKVSKQIVQEAIRTKAGTIVLEDLTNIRQRIRAGKKVRSRLHRWAFHQLQTLIEYKAQGHGLQILYVNPAWSSQTCSLCGCTGERNRHLCTCSCGNQQHSDLNASRTLCRFARSIDQATCTVHCT
jgi:putative transposase